MNIGSMYGIYTNIWGILMVNVTIDTMHGSYGYEHVLWNTYQFRRIISVSVNPLDPAVPSEEEFSKFVGYD